MPRVAASPFAGIRLPTAGVLAELDLLWNSGLFTLAAWVPGCDVYTADLKHGALAYGAGPGGGHGGCFIGVLGGLLVTYRLHYWAIATRPS